MENFIQFFIICEIGIYAASILSIVIILGLSSWLKLKQMQPINSVQDANNNVANQ